MADAFTGIRTRPVAAPIRRNPPAGRTPATVKAVAGQVRNTAGGMVFSIGDEARLHRFLTMGTEGGTFYLSEKALTKQNADVVFRAAAQAPLMLVKAIVEVSTAGRAPKYKPAIFALAIAASHADDAGRKAALDAVPQVCRNFTQLALFLKYVTQFRGWGRGLRKAVGAWYDDQDINKLAVQVVKYREREGWSQHDVLRKASDRGSRGSYTETFDDDHRLLYNYVAGNGLAARAGGNLPGKLPDVVLAFEALKKATTVGQVAKLVETPGVTWEMVPDKWINEPETWEALISKGVPQNALIRQLPRITRVFGGDQGWTHKVGAQLVDTHRLKGARIHPMQLLVAQKTYAAGRNDHGTTWTPNARINEALTDAFYASFGAFTPAGVRTLVGVDCSQSMSWDTSKTTGASMSCIEATAAVALVTAATEPESRFVGFDTRAWELTGISSRRWLNDVMAYLRSEIKGGTDVSQPILWALHNKVVVDHIQILTDGESWRGLVHPFEAMKLYRDRINPEARLSVVAMTATNTSVVAPFDDKAIDVSGFDASVPQILADFGAGRI